MSEFKTNLKKLSRGWTDKTLGLLYAEACAEETGIAFDAVKTPDGRRLMIVLCAAGKDLVQQIEKDLTFTRDHPEVEWNEFLHAEFLMRCGQEGGMTFEDLLDSQGKRHAIAFAAVGHESVEIVETLFEIK